MRPYIAGVSGGQHVIDLSVTVPFMLRACTLIRCVPLVFSLGCWLCLYIVPVLSICLVWLAVWWIGCLCLSVCVGLPCLPACPFVRLSVYLSDLLSGWLHVYLSLCAPRCLSLCLPVCPSARPISMSVHPSLSSTGRTRCLTNLPQTEAHTCPPFPPLSQPPG